MKGSQREILLSVALITSLLPSVSCSEGGEICDLDKEGNNGTYTESTWCDNGCCHDDNDKVVCCDKSTITSGTIMGLVITGSLVMTIFCVYLRLRIAASSVKPPTPPQPAAEEEEVSPEEDPPPPYWMCVSQPSSAALMIPPPSAVMGPPPSPPPPPPPSSSVVETSAVLATTPPPSVLATTPPPSVLATTPPPSVLATTPPPSVLATTPPSVLATTPSVLVTTPPPSELATTPPPSELATTPPPCVLATTPPPSVLATTPSVLATTPPPSVLATTPSVLATTPPFVLVTTPPVTSSVLPPSQSYPHSNAASCEQCVVTAQLPHTSLPSASESVEGNGRTVSSAQQGVLSQGVLLQPSALDPPSTPSESATDRGEGEVAPLARAGGEGGTVVVFLPGQLSAGDRHCLIQSSGNGAQVLVYQTTTQVSGVIPLASCASACSLSGSQSPASFPDVPETPSSVAESSSQASSREAVVNKSPVNEILKQILPGTVVLFEHRNSSTVPGD